MCIMLSHRSCNADHASAREHSRGVPQRGMANAEQICQCRAEGCWQMALSEAYLTGAASLAASIFCITIGLLSAHDCRTIACQVSQ